MRGLAWTWEQYQKEKAELEAQWDAKLKRVADLCDNATEWADIERYYNQWAKAKEEKAAALAALDSKAKAAGLLPQMTQAEFEEKVKLLRDWKFKKEQAIVTALNTKQITGKQYFKLKDEMLETYNQKMLQLSQQFQHALSEAGDKAKAVVAHQAQAEAAKIANELAQLAAAEEQTRKIVQAAGEFRQRILAARNEFLALRLRADQSIRDIYISAYKQAKSIFLEMMQTTKVHPKQYEAFANRFQMLLDEMVHLGVDLEQTLGVYAKDSVGLGLKVHREIFEDIWHTLPDEAKDLLPPVKVQAAFGVVNRQAVEAYWARVGKDGLYVSDRIWQIAAETRAAMKEIVGVGIALGMDAVKTANALETYVLGGSKTFARQYPNMMMRMAGRVKGGTCYEALRLARTEMAAAFGEGTVSGAKFSPACEGLKWTLGTTHPRPDICNDYAMGGNGEGVYQWYEIPAFPAHPNCICHLVPIYRPAEFRVSVEKWLEDPSSNRKLEEWYQGYFLKLPETQKWVSKLPDTLELKPVAVVANAASVIPPVPGQQVRAPIMPPAEELKLIGDGSYLGGAGQKTIYQGADGQQYIFKPAVSKGYPAKAEPFRAEIQEAANRLANIIFDEDQFIPVRVVELEGRVGTLQPLVKGVQYDLKSLGRYPDEIISKLTKDDLDQILREHVLDWSVGNFDSHAGNFLKMSDGRIIGVDKEQAFRYIKDPGSHRMSYTYHPNAAYGEWEPIYNTIYRAYAKGDIDLDLQAILKPLKRMEQLGAEEVEALFMPYAKALAKQMPGVDANELIGAIQNRLGNLREEYRKFYRQLIKEREGHNASLLFKFADETELEFGQRWAIEDMTVKQLKELAVYQGQIPKWMLKEMSKDELVEAICNDAARKEILEKVKARAYAKAKESRATKKTTKAKGVDIPEPIPSPADIGGHLDLDRIEDELKEIKFQRNHLGKAFRGDEQILEGQEWRIHYGAFGGKPGFRVTFKVRDKYIQEMKAGLEARGRVYGQWRFWFGNVRAQPVGPGQYRTIVELQTGGGLGSYSYAANHRNVVIADPKGRWELRASTGTEFQVLRGQMELVIKTDDIRDAAEWFQEALRELEFDKILLAPVPTEAEMIHKAMRYLWQADPRKAERIATTHKELSWAKLSSNLSVQDMKVIESMVEMEIIPGHRTWVIPGRHKEWQEKGAIELFSGVGRDAEGVVRIFQTGNGLSLSERIMHGWDFNKGHSTHQDMMDGGADYIFFRLTTRKGKGLAYSDSYAGSGYRLMVDLEQLDRTDWFAYNSDRFGRTRGPFWDDRPSVEDYVASELDNPRESNEIMFRGGVPLRAVKRITCDSSFMKDNLINAFKAAGMHRINGIPVEKFVVVKREW